MRIRDWSSDVCSSDLEPTSISSWPAAWAAAIHSFFLSVASVWAMLCRPSRKPTSRTTACLGHVLQGEVGAGASKRSEEHTSELQSLMRISYAVFCLKQKHNTHNQAHTNKNKQVHR